MSSSIQSFVAPVNSTIKLPNELPPGSVVFIRSATYDPKPTNAKVPIDNTFVNLRNGKDLLLQISIRRKEDEIQFNGHLANGAWGPAELVKPLKDVFPATDASIAVYDVGSHYHIMAGTKSLHHYEKRIEKNIDSVNYGADTAENDNSKTSALDEVIAVDTIRVAPNSAIALS